jgi:uncharacterized SAM-binding protein YcdF (DUF218 family)
MQKVYSFSLKPKRWLIALLFFGFLFFFLRMEILKSIGNFLISEDEMPTSISHIFVLSGNSYDRVNAAVSLSKTSRIGQFVCTGENQIPDMKVCCPTTFECDFTQMQLLKMGIDPSKILILKKGTSTLEESEEIMNYCIEHKISSIVILSNKFHTRRIRNVFVKKLKNKGIDVCVKGAPDSRYSEQTWWQSEAGLLAVNSEYIKLAYYLIK